MVGKGSRSGHALEGGQCHYSDKGWGERHKTKMRDGSKCLEEGDNRNKGGTCITPKWWHWGHGK